MALEDPEHRKKYCKLSKERPKDSNFFNPLAGWFFWGLVGLKRHL